MSRKVRKRVENATPKSISVHYEAGEKMGITFDYDTMLGSFIVTKFITPKVSACKAGVKEGMQLAGLDGRSIVGLPQMQTLTLLQERGAFQRTLTFQSAMLPETASAATSAAARGAEGMTKPTPTSTLRKSPQRRPQQQLQQHQHQHHQQQHQHAGESATFRGMPSSGDGPGARGGSSAATPRRGNLGLAGTLRATVATASASALSTPAASVPMGYKDDDVLARLRRQPPSRDSSDSPDAAGGSSGAPSALAMAAERTARSRDPFSTPARRRRLIADMTLFLLKQYSKKACI